ncbi:GNAT family N-acetyltransferase [Micromonospora sp. CPCC 206171]|uniref:GNAT family N-acetyltransferase n=1 Tax=Micromonospora sp. CPCC 206171 TaxID=3122405 RepID=UPI002FF19CD4
MTERTLSVDLGAALRALRRQADLSQRELAEKSGVPQATIARIESGRTTDPRFRTVEQLVRAASGRLGISLAAPGAPVGAGGPGRSARGANGDEVRDGALPAVPHEELQDGTLAAVAQEELRDGALPAVPHEELRDGAGRHCPAHLDAREVREPKDWPGAWWAHFYNLPPEQWPAPLPAVTYERNRERRDRSRRRERVRREVQVRRVGRDELPATSWRLVAELPDGELVGELRAHERSIDLLLGYDLGDRRELLLDGVLVAAEHRGLGIGRRLLDVLVTEMASVGITTVHAIAESGGIAFLLACGYRLQAGRPEALRLDRPVSSGPGPPPSGR